MTSGVPVEKDEKAAKRASAAPRPSLASRYQGRTLALVGMMGAGKSSIGRRLAEVLERPFFDSDEEIETAAGLSVSDIFALHGEEEFRRVERRVIERLLAEPPHVLATGGGAFVNSDTRAALQDHAATIWLDADLDVLWRRVRRRGGRPLLKADNPKAVLRDLLAERRPIYAKADIRITSADSAHADAVGDILEALQS